MGKKSQIRREKKMETEKLIKEFRKERENEQYSWMFFWKRWTFWVIAMCLGAALTYPFVADMLPVNNINNEDKVTYTKAIMDTSMGEVTISLYSKDAPETVENFASLASDGYYDGLTFHRVIKDFMIQGGDPKGDGTGGESYWGGKFEDEINANSLGLSKEQISSLESQGYKYRNDIRSHKAEIGSIAMANSGPDTNGSQFFIVTEQDQPHLNGKHTVFGKIVSGMEVVRKIAAVETDENDKPKESVIINSIELK